MVDLNVIIEALEANEFQEEATNFPNVLEFTKTSNHGVQDVFTLDFNDYTVTKNRYNANGSMQCDATKNFTVTRPSDLNAVMQSI